MIRPPRRSVTRFFIPLIDVLTLLFCIFLLMPLVGTSGEGALVETPAARDQRLRQLEEEVGTLRAQVKEQPADLREELERLRKEKIQTLKERLAIRVLEIGATDGKLFYHAPERVEVRDQADARDLIDRDRRERRDSRRELYYIILYPRAAGSAYPTVEQRERYDRWFGDVAHGWDIPGARGGPP